jgi:serine/threonine protein kinase
MGVLSARGKSLDALRGQQNILQPVAPINEFLEPFESIQGITIDVKFAYYAVELAETDVASLVERAALSARDKLQLFQEMCKAVQRLHSHQYVHRDLKPSNFLLMPDGALKLSDFGTARKIGDSENGLLPHYRFPPGDLLYTAPELLACLHDVDPVFARPADIYSLGSILFELFSRVRLGHYTLNRINVDLLMQTMGNIGRDGRVEHFLGRVATLSNAMVLPPVDSATDDVPRCIVQPLGRLYRSMSSIDYRTRLTSFEGIFRLISQCIFILNNEEKLSAWRARKEEFQRRAEEKRQRRMVAAQRLREV